MWSFPRSDPSPMNLNTVVYVDNAFVDFKQICSYTVVCTAQQRPDSV